MSGFFDQPIDKTAREAEKVADHTIDHVSDHLRKDTYDLLTCLFNLLEDKELVIRVSLVDKRTPRPEDR